MKNIIIVGPSRAGKTTLARKISEALNYYVISIDKLVAMFHEAYPQLDIRLNWNRDKTTDNIAPFLGHFLGVFSSSHGSVNELNLRAHSVTGNRFVLEGGYFHFEKISSILRMYGIEELKDNFLLIGLVQNKKSVDEYVNDFRKYDTADDWTYGFTDDELRAYVRQDAIPFNRSMTEKLMQYGFSIYDTSTEREQVLDQIVADMKLNTYRQGELTMITQQSNNTIPIIHRLITDEYGENYWFNGCAKYVMECLGEKDYDYWFFAGLTGDVFTQHYTYTKYAGDALSSYMMEENMGGNPGKFVEDVFFKCGYAATYVSNDDLIKNTIMYQNTLTAYIDKGIPVIVWGTPLVGVFVGYEDYGKTLLYITGNSDQPERVQLDKILRGEVEKLPGIYRSQFGGWIFVGEKKESRTLAHLYREAIRTIPQHQNIKTETSCFGAEAFRAWADDIESGKFDGMTVEAFDAWAYYTNYVCVLATNGSCCHEFLKRARELNPDMDYLEEISRLYKRTADIWNNDKGEDLEALGGGFNVTLKALQDKDKRKKIAAKIRECAEIMDTVVRVLNENLKEII
jgi:hypothetical protein